MKQEQKPFEIRRVFEFDDDEDVANYVFAANAEILRLQQQRADAPTWGEWVECTTIPKNIEDSFYEVEFLDNHTELWTMGRLNGYYSKFLVGKIMNHEIRQFRRLNYEPKPAQNQGVKNMKIEIPRRNRIDLYTSLRVMVALERLEKLEAAVAWHGWDEVPVSSKECYFIDIEIIDSKRKITRIVYNKETKLFTESALSSHVLLYGDEMKKHGFTGWRYPVGDLSE